MLNEPFPPGKLYEDALKDGVILCKLMNKLSPGCIKKIHEKGAHFKLTENVTRFQEAIAEYGVPTDDIFQTNDLSEKKDIANVTNTLHRLGVAVSSIPIIQIVLSKKCNENFAVFCSPMQNCTSLAYVFAGIEASRMEWTSIRGKLNVFQVNTILCINTTNTNV